MIMCVYNYLSFCNPVGGLQLRSCEPGRTCNHLQSSQDRTRLVISRADDELDREANKLKMRFKGELFLFENES